MHPLPPPPDGDGDGAGVGAAVRAGEVDGAGEGDREVRGDGEVRPGAGDVRPGFGEVRPGAGEVRPGFGEVRPGTRAATDGVTAGGCAWFRCRPGPLPCWPGRVVLCAGGKDETCWCGAGIRNTAAAPPPTTSVVAAVAVHTAGRAHSAFTADHTPRPSATSSATPTGGSPARHPERREARIAFRTVARAQSASSACDT